MMRRFVVAIAAVFLTQLTSTGYSQTTPNQLEMNPGDSQEFSCSINGDGSPKVWRLKWVIPVFHGLPGFEARINGQRKKWNVIQQNDEKIVSIRPDLEHLEETDDIEILTIESGGALSLRIFTSTNTSPPAIAGTCVAIPPPKTPTDKP
jgi:hypothetical protein